NEFEVIVERCKPAREGKGSCRVARNKRCSSFQHAGKTLLNASERLAMVEEKYRLLGRFKRRERVSQRCREKLWWFAQYVGVVVEKCRRSNFLENLREFCAQGCPGSNK